MVEVLSYKVEGESAKTKDDVISIMPFVITGWGQEVVTRGKAAWWGGCPKRLWTKLERPH